MTYARSFVHGGQALGLLISLRVLNLGVLLLVDISLLDEMNKIFVQQCAVMSIQKGDYTYDLHSVLKRF